MRRRAAMQLPAGVRVAGRLPKGLLFGEYARPSPSAASGSGVCSAGCCSCTCAAGDAVSCREAPGWFSWPSEANRSLRVTPGVMLAHSLTHTSAGGRRAGAGAGAAFDSHDSV